MNQYMPGDETSFTIIAFPKPDIGPDFEEIFRETIRINTLITANTSASSSISLTPWIRPGMSS